MNNAHEINNIDRHKASTKWNRENAHSGLPAHARPGSELEEPHAAIAKTKEGYDSYLVAVITKDAVVRVTQSGFRLITKSKGRDVFTIQRFPGRFMLENVASIQAFASTLSNHPELAEAMPKGVSPETITKACEGVPSSNLAFSAIRNPNAEPAWRLPEVTDMILKLRGW